MAQPITKIYLHWSATDYNWASPGTYHTVVQGNGAVRRLAGYDQPLHGHTHGRNSHAVSLCLACMGGDGWSSYPPRREQIDSLCREVANLAYRLGWTPEHVSIQRILTQAEAAANRDFPLEAARQVSGWSKPTSTVQAEEYSRRARLLGLPHENFGPTAWFDDWPTGYQERWGLWQLSPSDRPGEGGFRLRDMIRQYLQQAAIDARRSPRLRDVNLYINNRIAGRAWILTDNRAYAQLSTLTAAYGITTTWSAAKGYANLKTTQYQVKYLAAAPIFLGFPSVDIYLNRPEDASGVAIVDSQVLTRPFMQGLVIDNALWVSLADFCQELGIAIRVASDLSIYLGVSEPPPPPPTPAPAPAAPARPSDILRLCDIYLGETTFLSKGYLLADNRCYVKLANLATAYGFRLTWNGRGRYLNVISNRLQANYLEDAQPVSGYAIVPIFLNRPEDAQGNPIDSPQTPARPFMQGIIMENSAFVAIAEFCRELGITIRVDPDFSIHLGSIPQPPTPQPLTSGSGTTGSNGRMSVMPPYIVTPPPT
ncbi:MAG: hypothetical protein RML75_02920, partial [Cyanobacteriota bacterium SKYGB_h_bin112]|nr:hypothetical protein [Cyanobacteriota bacterium SKYGB_h_bin112]